MLFRISPFISKGPGQRPPTTKAYFALLAPYLGNGSGALSLKLMDSGLICMCLKSFLNVL